MTPQALSPPALGTSAPVRDDSSLSTRPSSSMVAPYPAQFPAPKCFLSLLPQGVGPRD